VVSHFKATLKDVGSISEQDLSFNYIYAVNLFSGNEAMISSMKFYFSQLSRWLYSRCQIAPRNKFREIGLNWHSAFPRAEMLCKLVANGTGAGHLVPLPLYEGHWEWICELLTEWNLPNGTFKSYFGNPKSLVSWRTVEKELQVMSQSVHNRTCTCDCRRSRETVVHLQTSQRSHSDD
jgi:hypothetical protein